MNKAEIKQKRVKIKMKIMYYCKKCHNIVFSEEDYTNKLCFRCERCNFISAKISDKQFDSYIKRLFVNSWGTKKIENCVSGFRFTNPLIIFDETKYVECGYGLF